MKKIKILQVTSSMDIGGIETFLMNLLRKIDKNKYEFIFLTYKTKKFDYEDELLSLGGKIIRISSPGDVSAFKHIREIMDVIRKEKVDVVHTHTYFNSGNVVLAAKLCGVKTRIVHSHTTLGSSKFGFAKSIKWFIARAMINLFCTDRFACGKEAGYALFRNKKTTILPNGINFNSFSYSEKYRNQLKKELKIEDDYVVIGHVGRLDYPKNHKFLIEIYAEYKKINPKSKLVLVGDGNLRRELEVLVSKKKLTNDVIFLGSRHDVYKIYNMFDLFLFPSIFEGIPVTLVEAQVNGISCLVSENVPKECKLTDLITFYSLDFSAKEWAGKLNKLKTTRTNEIEKILKSDYNIDNLIKKIEKIYEK